MSVPAHSRMGSSSTSPAAKQRHLLVSTRTAPQQSRRHVGIYRRGSDCVPRGGFCPCRLSLTSVPGHQRAQVAHSAQAGHPQVVHGVVRGHLSGGEEARPARPAVHQNLQRIRAEPEPVGPVGSGATRVSLPWRRYNKSLRNDALWRRSQRSVYLLPSSDWTVLVPQDSDGSVRTSEVFQLLNVTLIRTV